MFECDCFVCSYLGIDYSFTLIVPLNTESDVSDVAGTGVEAGVHVGAGAVATGMERNVGMDIDTAADMGVDAVTLLQDWGERRCGKRGVPGVLRAWALLANTTYACIRTHA